MNAVKTLPRLAVLLLAVSLVIGLPGCAGKEWKQSKIFSLDSTWPFGDDEPEEGVPVRMVGAWTDTVLTKPGQKPRRGFGGRIMFYGEEGDEPILVDGQLVVYAFDEAGRAPTDNKPTRRYVFPPDQVKLHMSNSDVGASYSFWLPWDEVGGPKAEVSLICRFEPKGGAIVTGEQTRHLLPGTMPGEATATSGALRVPEGEPMRPAQVTLEQLQAQQQQRYHGAQLASYESVAGSQPAANSNVVNTGAMMPGRQMSVTSIHLPRDFQMPDAAAVAPTTVRGQVESARPITQPAQPALFQQPAGVQPINPAAQPPATTGAAAMPQQAQVLNPLRAVPSSNTPAHGGFAMPTPATPFVSQQGVAVPGIQAMMQPSTNVMPPGTTMVGTGAQLTGFTRPQIGSLQQSPQFSQQPMIGAQGQQMIAAPQQLPPQQTWQQLPTSAIPPTAARAPQTATIPWR
jgi:hypothetical protein